MGTGAGETPTTKVGVLRHTTARIRTDVDVPAVRHRILRFFERLPVWLACVYAFLLVLLLKFVVEAVYSNADIASGPVLGDLYPGQGPVVLGFLRWFEGFWIERATTWVPGHRYLWT